MINYIESLIIRDLDNLKNELNLLKNDSDLYKTKDGITNSIGNLSQHICGNLRHFIGASLGKTGYIRNREDEFDSQVLTILEISQLIEETKTEVKLSFSQLKEEDLSMEYPLLFLGKKLNTDELLFILMTHLSYHLGQVNYLRRML